eukprot:scaffold28017_cov58-Phaeocystis_antarctica.AAC.6
MPGELKLGRTLFRQPSAALSRPRPRRLPRHLRPHRHHLPRLPRRRHPHHHPRHVRPPPSSTAAPAPPGTRSSSRQGSAHSLVAFDSALCRVGRAWRALPPPPQARAEQQVERE